MQDHDAPILEFDPSRRAVIEPAATVREPIDLPPRAVLCFFPEVIAEAVREFGGREVGRLVSEIGPNPIFEIASEGRRLAVVHPGVGAPLAAAFLEELIARGCRAFVACGGAGVLVPEVVVGQVIVPTAAIGDEGTSYHYLPPAREVAATPAAVEAIVATLERHDVPHRLGKTWTTDALYRETHLRVQRRVDEGCLTVEMEAAAFFAVAIHRGVTFGQLLYAGDDLSGDSWDARAWDRDRIARSRLFSLAAEAVLRLPDAD